MSAVAERETMEKIEPMTKFIVQYWADNFGAWMDIHSHDDYESAQDQKERREKIAGHENIKYRIVRATTTYEVMEETE